MAEMAGRTLPLKVTGTISAPSVLPDFNAIARQRAQEEVDEEVEEKKEEVREELRDRLRGIFNR
jgi:hypothetical protein